MKMFIPEVQDTKETLQTIINLIEKSVSEVITVSHFEGLVMAISEPDLQNSKSIIMNCFRWMLIEKIQCLDFHSPKLMLAETYSLIIKKLLSFDKLLT